MGDAVQNLIEEYTRVATGPAVGTVFGLAGGTHAEAVANTLAFCDFLAGLTPADWAHMKAGIVAEFEARAGATPPGFVLLKVQPPADWAHMPAAPVRLRDVRRCAAGVGFHGPARPVTSDREDVNAFLLAFVIVSAGTSTADLLPWWHPLAVGAAVGLVQALARGREKP